MQVNKDRLPIDPTTGLAIEPCPQPGYYPGYSTLSQQQFWDEATRTLVLKRVNEVPPIRFFRPDEAALMQAVIDRVLPQDDRDDAHKIPVLNYVDERLYNGVINGYRYVDMPPDDQAYRLGLEAVEEIAHYLHRKPFRELGQRQQDEVLKTIHDGNPPVPKRIWERMSVKHFWSLLLQNVAEAYYAHPWAWDEIGFGGPAYPRGYMRLNRGEPEPYEVDEQRYAWAPPPESLSGDYSPFSGEEPLVHEGHR
jgi:gluconate 2-dehydrogenase subunit 3-like protein